MKKQTHWSLFLWHTYQTVRPMPLCFCFDPLGSSPETQDGFHNKATLTILYIHMLAHIWSAVRWLVIFTLIFYSLMAKASSLSLSFASSVMAAKARAVSSTMNSIKDFLIF